MTEESESLPPFNPLAWKTCPQCQKLFQPTVPWQKVCGMVCAKQRQNEQLKSHGEKRKERKQKPLAKTCRVCGGEFVTATKRKLDCSPKCAEQSLKLAVERQKQRREEAKKVVEKT